MAQKEKKGGVDVRKVFSIRHAAGALFLAVALFGVQSAYADEVLQGFVGRAAFATPGDVSVMRGDDACGKAGKGAQDGSSSALVRGWNHRDGLWYWADADGAPASTGWLRVGDSHYWLDPANGGAMATGPFEVDGVRYVSSASGALVQDAWALYEDVWYYANPSGSLYTGWLFAGGDWYWLDPKTGAMAHDSWVDVNEVRFYLGADGVMETGWVFVEGGWYLIDDTGALQYGWAYIDGVWYWLDPAHEGLMATGLFEVDGFKYCAPSQGAVAIDGWCSFDGAWYYADGSGALASGWFDVAGRTYWLDPATNVMATGIVELDGKKYWLDESGALAKGSVLLDGELHFADATGAICFEEMSWQNVAGKTYYVGKGGILATGWFEHDGTRYFFDEHGALGEGWLFDEGAWYWLGSDGVAKSGWQHIGGWWFWFDRETFVMAVGWTEIDGAWYKFDSAGFMQTGWINESGSWYYCRDDGSMATGWQYVGGAWYWLDPETGIMATGWLQLDDGWYWLSGSGAMATGWVDIGGSAYKLDLGGRWVENTGSVLGVSRTRLVEWLWSHENDWYYLGTPYSHGFSLNTCLYPNGALRWDGFAGMNCTGFVAHAYSMAGGAGDLDAIGWTQSYSPWPTGPGGGSYINAWRWYGYAIEHGAEMYTFDSVASMLASGTADKGDIIFFKTNGAIDCHIGFFWGNTPYENKMWHQIYPQNCISACFNNANKAELYQQTVLIKGCW